MNKVEGPEKNADLPAAGRHLQQESIRTVVVHRRRGMSEGYLEG